MCLEVKSEKKISRFYILCTKRGTMCGNGKFTPQYRHQFQYTPLIKTPKVELEVVQDEIYKGYHSYTRIFNPFTMEIRTGDYVCLIPPNTAYYEGHNDEYVSETLIFVGSKYEIKTWIQVFKMILFPVK